MNKDGGLNMLGSTLTGLSRQGTQPRTYEQAEAQLKAETAALSEKTGGTRRGPEVTEGIDGHELEGDGRELPSNRRRRVCPGDATGQECGTVNHPNHRVGKARTIWN